MTASAAQATKAKNPASAAPARAAGRDLRPLAVVLAGLALVCIKLVLCSAQRVHLDPDNAPIDDMLMFNLANSIVRGEWLGEYNWLTLSKHSFFALWLAGLHILGIPFLLGGQLLWAAASAALAGALRPAFPKRWVALALFAVLLFNPASTAAFTLRVYRDNIFPALCTLCVAGMVGFALRWRQKLLRTVGWLVLAGAALAGCILCREDGWWLLPFVVDAAVITAVFVVRGGRQRAVKCLALLLPFVIMWGGVGAWKAQNKAHYGVFAVSDFSTGAFADAYGAMTRVRAQNWNPRVAVPFEVRTQLYALVPAFAELEPLLESPWFLGRYGYEGEYTSGGFYWALREAAYELGHYDTPQKAEAFWAGIARDINALCDDGTLDAGPPRSSVNPPIRAYYILPVLSEGIHSLGFVARFAQCDPRPPRSVADYEEKIQPMEAFLREEALMAARENTDLPYYSPFQRLCFAVFDCIRAVYAVLLPAAAVLALGWQLWGGARLVARLRRRAAQNSAETLLWLVLLGLLACILLRVFMIAFVTVSSFTIGTYVMYLASVHPLMLAFGFVGTAQLWQTMRARRLPAAKGGAA